jgi:hypothetical protein
MNEPEQKMILVLDFDGVIHTHEKWEGATVIKGKPIEGAFEAIVEYVKHFRVCILSTRSKEPGGIDAMKQWFFEEKLPIPLAWLEFPRDKPPIHMSIDDRGFQFKGKWPSVEYIKNFKPWYKK